MAKIAIWEISCFYSLLPPNNVEKKREKVASSYVMGLQHCIAGEERYIMADSGAAAHSSLKYAAQGLHLVKN